MTKRVASMERSLCLAVALAWRSHGTKVLGSCSAILPGLLAIDGLVPKAQMKWWLAANVVIGALTVHRGFVNSQNLK